MNSIRFLKQLSWQRYSGRDRKLWAVEGRDARSLVSEFLTIQCYIRGDKEQFEGALTRTRSMLVGARRDTSRSKLLLDVMEANQLILAAEASALNFSPSDILDLDSIARDLRSVGVLLSQGGEVEDAGVSGLIWRQLPEHVQIYLLADFYGDSIEADFREPLQEGLLEGLNAVIRGALVYTPPDRDRSLSIFPPPNKNMGINLSPYTARVLSLSPSSENLVRLNRMLLEDAFPHVIRNHRELFAVIAKRYAFIAKRQKHSHAGKCCSRLLDNRREDAAQERLIIGLIKHNRAYCLEKAGAALSEVEAQYWSAITYRPIMPMFRRSLAEFYLREGLWDAAATAFREDYVVRAQGGDRKTLNADLANVRRLQAKYLRENPSEKRLDEALRVLDDALNSLDWSGISGWKGLIRFERGLVLEQLKRPEEAATEYLQSADCCQIQEDFVSATFVGTKWGDLLCILGSFTDGADAYDLELKHTDRIKELPTRREREDNLKARRAIVALYNCSSDDCHKELITRWRKEEHFGTHTWGPNYDVLWRANPILGRHELRHAANIYYHQLLKENEDLESDRDLTAALLYLYEYERKDLERTEDIVGQLKGLATSKQMLPVVTPIAIEISEKSANRIVLDETALKTYMNPVRESVDARYGVKIPGVRVRSSPDREDGEYVLMINEVPLALGTHDKESLAKVFRHLEVLLVKNLVEFLGHQEVQNFLERNQIVQPTIEDISDKENCRHMDPLALVLRALVSERVPLTEPHAIYQMFRSCWKQSVPLGDIVENIRRIPQLRHRLWGNDGTYDYVWVSELLETWIESCMRTSGDFNVLVGEPREVQRILDALADQLQAFDRPVLVVRRQVHRAIVRQLIADGFAEVPVLSAYEIRLGVSPIASVADLSAEEQ